jgi:hypothetical protein
MRPRRPRDEDARSSNIGEEHTEKNRERGEIVNTDEIARVARATVRRSVVGIHGLLHTVFHIHSYLLFVMHSMNSPKRIARLFVRIGFGLALAFTGFAHYKNPDYPESVSRGLGFLEPLGEVWGYILPGLMIVGGLLLAFGIYMNVAAYLTSIALASIPAGLMLKSAISEISMDDTMPPAMNALVWILVLMVALKGANQGCCCCCGPNCTCDVPGTAPMAPKPAPVKSTVAPMATVKTAPVMPAKKPMPPAKKPAPAKKK